MGLSHDVRLEKDRAPVFPDRCVNCARERPEAALEYSCAHRSILWNFLIFLPGFRRIRVQVPVCAECLPLVRRRRRLKWWVELVVILAVVAVVYLITRMLDWSPRKPTRLFIVFLACIPAFALFSYFPPPFDLTPLSTHVDYEFRDLDYAREFAALNDAEVE
jgi:hypothetical protein